MRISLRVRTLAIIGLFTLLGCTSDKSMQWKAPLYHDHPLTGKIWIPAEGRYASPDELYAAAGKADFLLIGEKHDNADHHLLQARLISEVAATGRKGAVVFEMLTQSQQKALDDHLSAHPKDAAGIRLAVGWDGSGWPAWENYEPIFRQVVDNGMTAVAGSLDRATIKEIARQGPEALGEGRVSELKLDLPVAKEIRAEMREVIFKSHCEQLPEHLLDPMVSVTLAKDSAMADKMLRSRDAPQAISILIAGGGHVRKDWGVPMHLTRLNPEANLLSVGLMEVEKDVVDPSEYTMGPQHGEPFDFVWFTARLDENDPCEAFAEQLRKLREQSEEQDGSPAD